MPQGVHGDGGFSFALTTEEVEKQKAEAAKREKDREEQGDRSDSSPSTASVSNILLPDDTRVAAPATTRPAGTSKGEPTKPTATNTKATRKPPAKKTATDVVARRQTRSSNKPKSPETVESEDLRDDSTDEDKVAGKIAAEKAKKAAAEPATKDAAEAKAEAVKEKAAKEQGKKGKVAKEPAKKDTAQAKESLAEQKAKEFVTKRTPYHARQPRNQAATLSSILGPETTAKIAEVKKRDNEVLQHAQRTAKPVEPLVGPLGKPPPPKTKKVVKPATTDGDGSRQPTPDVDERQERRGKDKERQLTPADIDRTFIPFSASLR
jgi:hypothetical protein